MGASVLLVHDDLATIAAVRRLLTREGHEVILATSVADALIAYGYHLPALIALAPAVESGRGPLVLDELAMHPDASRARVLLLGEPVAGSAAPVAPLPVEGRSFAQLVDSLIHAPADPSRWTPGRAAPAPSSPSPTPSTGSWSGLPPEAEPSEEASSLEQTLFGDIPKLEQTDWATAALPSEERAAREATQRGHRDALAAASAFGQTEKAVAAALPATAPAEPGAKAAADELELQRLEDEVRREAAARRNRKQAASGQASTPAGLVPRKSAKRSGSVASSPAPRKEPVPAPASVDGQAGRTDSMEVTSPIPMERTAPTGVMERTEPMGVVRPAAEGDDGAPASVRPVPPAARAGTEVKARAKGAGPALLELELEMERERTVQSAEPEKPPGSRTGRPPGKPLDALFAEEAAPEGAPVAVKGTPAKGAAAKGVAKGAAAKAPAAVKGAAAKAPAAVKGAAAKAPARAEPAPVEAGAPPAHLPELEPQLAEALARSEQEAQRRLEAERSAEQAREQVEAMRAEAERGKQAARGREEALERELEQAREKQAALERERESEAGLKAERETVAARLREQVEQLQQQLGAAEDAQSRYRDAGLSAQGRAEERGQELARLRERAAQLEEKLQQEGNEQEARRVELEAQLEAAERARKEVEGQLQAEVRARKEAQVRAELARVEAEAEVRKGEGVLEAAGVRAIEAAARAEAAEKALAQAQEKLEEAQNTGAQAEERVEEASRARAQTESLLQAEARARKEAQEQLQEEQKALKEMEGRWQAEVRARKEAQARAEQAERARAELVAQAREDKRAREKAEGLAGEQAQARIEAEARAEAAERMREDLAERAETAEERAQAAERAQEAARLRAEAAEQGRAAAQARAEEARQAWTLAQARLEQEARGRVEAESEVQIQVRAQERLSGELARVRAELEAARAESASRAVRLEEAVALYTAKSRELQAEVERLEQALAAEREQREFLSHEVVRLEAARAQVEQESAGYAAEAENARHEAEQSVAQSQAEVQSMAAKLQAAVLSLAAPGKAEVAVPRSGSVDAQDLARLITRLAEARVPVRVELKGAEALRILWLKGGALVGALSSSPEESVAGRAREDGLIDERQEAELRMVRSTTPGAVLDVLRSRGWLREPELIPLVQRYTEHVVLAALAESSTLYRLLDEAPPPEVLLAASSRPLLHLVAEGLRENLSTHGFLGKVGGLRARLARSADSLSPEAFGLPARELYLLEALEEEQTIEQRLLGAGLPQDMALKALTLACALGLLTTRPPSATEPSQAPVGELDKRRVESKYEEVQDADYFTVLGLPRSAGSEQVRRAYELLSAEFHPMRFSTHPDASLRSRAHQITQVLGEAVQALSDDRLREEYARNLLD